MRWNVPHVGERRYRKFFAWYPVSSGNEWRWWETLYVEECYMWLTAVYGWGIVRYMSEEQYDMVSNPSKQPPIAKDSPSNLSA